MLSDSSTFLKFWLADECRETFIKHVAKPDLVNLRLVCHDFSVRTAPTLFDNVTITFKPRTFTRPARQAALQRIGHYIHTLTLNLPHTPDSYLPPLIHPETGEELNFTYTPQLSRQPSSQNQSEQTTKYSDPLASSLLESRYPPLFHASTNVLAFVTAFDNLPNLSHLHITSPHYDPTHRNRRSSIDYALISLRLAIERNPLPSLTRLTLSHLHPGALLYLSPLLGHGATPASVKKWSQITVLDISLQAPLSIESGTPNMSGHPNPTMLLHTYLHNFQPNLQSFSFAWLNGHGPSPFPPSPPSRKLQSSRTQGKQPHTAPLHFPKLESLRLTHVETSAVELTSWIDAHKLSLWKLEFAHVRLGEGSWERVVGALTQRERSGALGEGKRGPGSRRMTVVEVLGDRRSLGGGCGGSEEGLEEGLEEIPIMLGLSSGGGSSTAIGAGTRVEVPRVEARHLHPAMRSPPKPTPTTSPLSTAKNVKTVNMPPQPPPLPPPPLVPLKSAMEQTSKPTLDTTIHATGNLQHYHHGQHRRHRRHHHQQQQQQHHRGQNHHRQHNDHHHQSSAQTTGPNKIGVESSSCGGKWLKMREGLREGCEGLLGRVFGK